MSDHDAWLDIGEAARFLGVSATSLRRWTNSGRLACVRVGQRRERRFRRADLLAYLEEQPVGALPRGAPGTTRAPRHAAALPLGTHLCGLYASDLGRATLAAGFLAHGLGPGTVCYLVGSADARNAILGRLEEEHPGVATDLAAERLVLRDTGDYAFFETAFGAAVQRGVRALHVVGDMAWCLERGMTLDAIVDFEHGYDTVIAPRFPVVSLCQYDLRRFSGPAVVEVLKVHPDTLSYPGATLAPLTPSGPSARAV
ncbi:MAG TPA: MEDS domain-containing protein [Gemmatimonadales bacterium]|nr:MEDS domain-containing protein [Gemmatimonadales bacterium]